MRLRKTKALAVVLSGIVGIGWGLVAPQSASAGMAVTPSKIELTVEAGGTQNQDVSVVNTNPNAIRLRLKAWDFARDESGRAVPVGPKDVKLFRGMASWVTFADRDFAIPSGSVGNVKLTIRVPADAEPGAHYTYLRFSGVPVVNKKSKGVVVPINYNINALLVVEVPGATAPGEPPTLRRAVKITGLAAPRVSFGGQVPLQIHVENSGNVHLNFRGKVKLARGMYQINSADVPEYTLLPYSKMNIVQPVRAGLPFGYYQVTVVGNVGLKKPLVAKNGFWVVPLTMLLWALAALVVVIVLVVVLRGRFQLVRRAA